MQVSKPSANSINLASSGARQSLTGTTTKTTLASVVIPAGLMGPNSSLEIDASFSYTNSANAKTTVIAVGPAAASTVELFNRGNAGTGNFAQAPKIILLNRGVLNSQVLPYAANSSYGTNIGLAPITSTIDFSVDQTIWLFGTLANTAETIALESLLVNIFNPRR